MKLWAAVLWGMLHFVSSQETMKMFGHTISGFPSDATLPGPFTIIDMSVPEFPAGKIALVQFHIRRTMPFYLQVWRQMFNPLNARFKLIHSRVISPPNTGGFMKALEVPLDSGDRLGLTFNSSDPAVSYLVDSSVDNYFLSYGSSALPAEEDVVTVTERRSYRFAWVVRVQVGATVTAVPEPSEGAQYFGSNIEERANLDSPAMFSYIDANSPLAAGVAVRIHYYNGVASKVVRLQIWRLNDNSATSGRDFKLVFEMETSSSSIGQQQVRVNFQVEQNDVLGFTSNDAEGGTISYDTRQQYAGYMRQGTPTLESTYEFQPSARQYAIGVVVATLIFTTEAPLVTPAPPAGGQYVGNPIRQRAKSDASDAQFAYIDYAESNRLPAGEVSRILYYSSRNSVPIQLQLWRHVEGSSQFTLIYQQSSTSTSGLNTIGVNWQVQKDDVLGFTNTGPAGAIDYDQDTTTYEGFQLQVVQGNPVIGSTLLFNQEATKVYSMGVHVVANAQVNPPPTTQAPPEAVRISNQLTSRGIRDQQGQASYTYIDSSTSKILPAGQLKKFLFFAAVGHQSLLLQIWRLDNIDIRRFRLVHQTQYTPTTVGIHEVPVDFRTLNGDRIGFTNPGEEGPIPYDSGNNGYPGLQRSRQIGQTFEAGSTLLDFTEEVHKIFSFGVEVVADVVNCTEDTRLDIIGKSVQARPGTIDAGGRRTFLQLDIIMRVGVVTGYLMYVNTYNPVRVQLWRPSTQDKFADKKFQLLHEKRVVPSQPGYLQVILAESEYFYTKFGDLLGFTNEQDVGPIAYTFTPNIYNPQYFYAFPGVDYPKVGEEYRFNDLKAPFQFSLAAYLNTNPCEILPIPAYVTTLAPATISSTTPAPMPGPPGPKGEQGEAGAIGPAGLKGATGDPGTKGEPGLAGAAGANGVDGAPGAKGDKGEVGSSGQKGAKGEVGSPGVQGPNGFDGSNGLDGANGADGVPGAKGDKGEVGEQGSSGPPGTQGGIGIQGPPGQKGQLGEAGPKGFPGPPGAAGSAGADGATGLDGAKGAKGEPGEKGVAGDQGLAGVQGPSGSAGDKGAPGEVGQPGQKGDPGATGPDGNQGPDGAQGAIGDKGEAGEKGTKGEGGLGIVGPPGNMGIVGPPGVIGAPGPDGNRGLAGPPGPPGPPGQTKVFAVWAVNVGNEVTGRPEVYGSSTASRRKRQASPEGGYIDIEAHHALPRGLVRAFTFYVVRENLPIFCQVYRTNRNDPTTATLIAQQNITPTKQGVFTEYLKEPIAVELGDWIGFYNPNTQGVIPYEEVGGTFGYNTVLPPPAAVGGTVQLQRQLMKKFSFAAVVDANNDECADVENGCDQLCIDTYGSYQCACNSGYMLQADQHTCSDINECNSNNGGCQFTCTNSDGGYTCSCPAGYSLTGDKHTCTDVNECSGATHGCTQDCENTQGSYQCRCNQGYELQADAQTCQDINECNSNNGGCQFTCTNSDAGYTCSCPAGYSLTGNKHTCTDNDECFTNNGGCAGVCQNTAGSFLCSCAVGYSLGSDGTSCADIDECAGSNLCQGTCTNSIGSYMCTCPAGSTLSSNGYYCQSDNSGNSGSDFCTAANSCPSGQTCVSSTAGKQCITEYNEQSVPSAVTSEMNLVSDNVVLALVVWLAVVSLLLLILIVCLCLRRNNKHAQANRANAYDWSKYDDNAYSTTPYAQEKPASSFVYPQYPEAAPGGTLRGSRHSSTDQ